MEYYSLVIFGGFVVASVFIVILISIFGAREKSYDEAIAEQRQKEKDIAFQIRNEKLSKKKQLKKSKDKKEKSRKSEERIHQVEVTGSHQKGKNSPQNTVKSNIKGSTKVNVSSSKAEVVQTKKVKKEVVEKNSAEKEQKKKVVKEGDIKIIKNVNKPEEVSNKTVEKLQSKSGKNENKSNKAMKSEENEKRKENKSKSDNKVKNEGKTNNKQGKTDKEETQGKVNEKLENKPINNENKQTKTDKSTNKSTGKTENGKSVKGENKSGNPSNNKSVKSTTNKSDDGGLKKSDTNDRSGKNTSGSPRKQNFINKNEDDVVIKTKSHNLNSNKKEDSSLPSSPTKRMKKQKFDIGSGDNGMNGTHLATRLRNAILTEAELQTLIDILLNRQQEGESWVKLGQKIDPISALKKQLQETEQKFSDEQLLSQTTSNKLKELRQELNKSVQMERSTREKLAAQQQEYQTLQVHFQRNHEQHVSEMNAMQMKFQQIQVKTNEEHHLALQRLQEENEKLQQALAQMEANSKNVTTSEITRLQCDIEQWRITCEQYKEQMASSQKAENELQQRNHQLQQCIQEVNANKVQQEKVLQQEINDLVKRLAQMEAGNNSLQRDLCNYQNIQAENNSLHNQIHELESAKNSYCHRVQDLEEQLHSAKAETEACVLEIETKQRSVEQELLQSKDEINILTTRLEETRSQIAPKDALLAKQQNDLTRYLDEVQKLTKELDFQQEKNDALRKKNWKAMEALSLTEKLGEEKCKKLMEAISASEKQLQQMKQELQRVFPNCTFDEAQETGQWISEIENVARRSQDYENVEEELRHCRINMQEIETSLTSQVQHYKEALQNTESMLTALQRRVEEEDHVWREKLSYKENDFRQIEEQLSEIQSKLHIEENERKLAELKSSETAKLLSSLEQHLDEKNKQFVELEIKESNLNNQIEKLESQLESDKKVIKDLNSQLVKLNSLVRIGEDSLKAEQEVVRELQKKIAEQKMTATNGTSLNNTVDAVN